MIPVLYMKVPYQMTAFGLKANWIDDEQIAGGKHGERFKVKFPLFPWSEECF